jgi:hypothetical protein
MEHRDDGLMVDFGAYDAFKDTGRRQGRSAVIENTKQEAEMRTLDQETRLMHAMNEIRSYAPKRMTPGERQMFDAMCENIFRKHGITPEVYRSQFGHLGTPQNLRR